MSKPTKKPTPKLTAPKSKTSTSTDTLALLEKVEQAERAAKRSQKQAAMDTAWKEKTLARNPAVLVDTLRDVEAGTVVPGTDLVSKGRVVDIACQYEGCILVRTVNVQDAFQVRYCAEHKGVAAKARSRAARLAKKVGTLDTKTLQVRLKKAEADMAQTG